MSHTSRIAVARRFGPPEVITIEEHSVPKTDPGHVLVAVRIGGLNPIDARRRAGTFGGSPPLVFGTEFAGVVIESADAAWRPGDEVIGFGVNGGDADAVVAPGSQLQAKPAEIPWEVAGGLSGVGQAALTALDSLSLDRDDLIVVHGAAGGVGTVLVQFAVAQGLRVIGTGSEERRDYLRTLGAIPVAYGPGLAKRLADAADGAPIAASIDFAGTAEAGDTGLAVRAAGGQSITMVPETMQSHGIKFVQVQRSNTRLRQLLDAVVTGSLTFPVETVPFKDIVEAHRRLDAKHARGKLVLDLSDNPLLPGMGEVN
ncbi:NADP-dependent oxidoreductase [Streptomyces sp. NPDC058232]|uniref:NADP-dependent oxidoreductase n=1 Tax=Streptomyces sp. NPDC058232 TaxID=3346393 RepID=UPI0036E52098